VLAHTFAEREGQLGALKEKPYTSMASQQPIGKNFQRGQLKGLEEKLCSSQLDFKIYI
jgi:hypothetical protein